MDRMAPRHAVLIYGPTASGKSALAMRLAQDVRGVVINADALQVYRELRILTNRPSPDDERLVAHSLYGFRPMGEPYSAALWLEDVKDAMDAALAEGKLPIVVGGTGLYFTALTEGLSHIPEVSPEVRMKYRLAAQSQPPEALHGLLAKRDPLTASRLRPSDPQRIVRALEVLETTGRPLSEWQSVKAPPVLPLEQAYPIALAVDRDELYRRCDARFDAMIAAGAVEEARSIASLGLHSALPAMRAVGLPPLLAFLRSEIAFEEASEAAKTQTRNYAKRQLTWAKKHFVSWNLYYLQEYERIKHELDNLF
jgi:tRNA dimethylallyltransferase